MKPTIYVAAPFVRKEEARAARDTLIAAGYEVEARWLDLHDTIDSNDPNRQAYLAEQAMHDVTDVFNADILILLNLEKSEGKAVEYGLALAWRKPAIIIGERTNIFHWLPTPVVASLDEAIALMEQWEVDRQTAVEKQESLKLQAKLSDLTGGNGLKDLVKALNTKH